jgi:hypothetical protein
MVEESHSSIVNGVGRTVVNAPQALLTLFAPGGKTFISGTDIFYGT